MTIPVVLEVPAVCRHNNNCAPAVRESYPNSAIGRLEERAGAGAFEDCLQAQPWQCFGLALGCPPSEKALIPSLRVWSSSNSTDAKPWHVPGHRQHPYNGNHARKTLVLNMAQLHWMANNLFVGGRSGGRSVITKRPKTYVYAVRPGVLPR